MAAKQEERTGADERIKARTRNGSTQSSTGRTLSPLWYKYANCTPVLTRFKFTWNQLYLPPFFSKGLTAQKVKVNIARDGFNRLTPPKGVSEWSKFAKNLLGGFQLLLWFGSFLCITAFLIEYTSSTNPSPDNVNFKLFNLWQFFSWKKLIHSFIDRCGWVLCWLFSSVWRVSSPTIKKGRAPTSWPPLPISSPKYLTL